MLKMEKKKTIEQKEQSWWKRTPSLPCLMGNRKNTIFLVSCSILETGGYSHLKMLSETSKAQKTSIKKSKTCSWREWQNLSIFKKCIKNHSSSSKNCYSTGRGSKVHTSAQIFSGKLQVVLIFSQTPHMIYSSSHLRQCEWRGYAQWGILWQYFRRLSSWSWGRDTRRICWQSPHNSTSSRYLSFCNKPQNLICDSLLSTFYAKKNIQDGIMKIVDNAHVTSLPLEQASLQCKERHLSQLMADRDQVRQ